MNARLPSLAISLASKFSLTNLICNRVVNVVYVNSYTICSHNDELAAYTPIHTDRDAITVTNDGFCIFKLKKK